MFVSAVKWEEFYECLFSQIGLTNYLEYLQDDLIPSIVDTLTTAFFTSRNDNLDKLTYIDYVHVQMGFVETEYPDLIPDYFNWLRYSFKQKRDLTSIKLQHNNLKLFGLMNELRVYDDEERIGGFRNLIDFFPGDITCKTINNSINSFILPKLKKIYDW